MTEPTEPLGPVGKQPGKASTAASKEARLERVALLLKAGYRYRAIAANLKREGFPCALSTVSKDANNLLARWREEQSAAIEDARALDLARLDDIYSSLSRRAASGDVQAIDRQIQVLKMRADIFGYKAPVKTAIGGATWEGAAPIAIKHVEPEPDLSHLSEPELKELLRMVATTESPAE